MKKEWLLAVGSVGLTLVIALALIRWLAPQLLGLPTDLQMVRVAKEVPPFYDGVFRREDYTSKDYLIADPIILRAMPLFPDLVSTGPNDLLGFRNRHIPTVADVVTIGDSQTYGNNVPLEQAWPGDLRNQLPAQTEVYNMSTGGWGAVQYYEIFSKALYLRPRAVIVAFYTGNDPIESFALAYGNDRWRELRPDLDLTPGDMPKATFPAPPEEQWRVTFDDGGQTVFTPQLRYASNQPLPAIRAGYNVMAKTAQLMSDLAGIAGARLVLTIIPTKELVYAEKLKRSGITPTAPYAALVEAEQNNIAELASKLREVPNARYVDVVSPLQSAALGAGALYPADENGHPNSAGYAVIARVLTPTVADLFKPLPEGFVVVHGADGSNAPRWLHQGRQWAFSNAKSLVASGWDQKNSYPAVTPRDLANVPYGDPGDGPTARQRGGTPAAP